MKQYGFYIKTDLTKEEYSFPFENEIEIHARSHTVTLTTTEKYVAPWLDLYIYAQTFDNQIKPTSSRPLA